MNDVPPERQTPTKVQCAECHWQGLSSDLRPHGSPAGLLGMLMCPICNAPFARYPQRAEHLWSDPY